LEAIPKVENLDELAELHNNILDEIARRALLTRESAPIMDLVQEILSLAWHTPDETPLYQPNQTFKDAAGRLNRLLFTTAKIEGRQHLSTLLLNWSLNDQRA